MAWSLLLEEEKGISESYLDLSKELLANRCLRKLQYVLENKQQYLSYFTKVRQRRSLFMKRKLSSLNCKTKMVLLMSCFL